MNWNLVDADTMPKDRQIIVKNDTTNICAIVKYDFHLDGWIIGFGIDCFSITYHDLYRVYFTHWKEIC